MNTCEIHDDSVQFLLVGISPTLLLELLKTKKIFAKITSYLSSSYCSHQPLFPSDTDTTTATDGGGDGGSHQPSVSFLLILYKSASPCHSIPPTFKRPGDLWGTEVLGERQNH